MYKELKVLQETICLGCPCQGDNMKACDIAYCDKREAFHKVEAAFENVKKDLIGRQKKIASLTVENAGALAMRDHYEEHYVVECAKNRNLYAKYISVVRENMDLKIKLNKVDECSKENVKKDLAGRQKKNKQKKIESPSFDTTGLCEGQVD